MSRRDCCGAVGIGTLGGTRMADDVLRTGGIGEGGGAGEAGTRAGEREWVEQVGQPPE